MFLPCTTNVQEHCEVVFVYLPPPTFNRFTLADRWKIFSLFYGFLEEPTAGNFIWVPDDSTKFANLKASYDSASNPTGKDYDNKLFHFAEFWYNRREEYYRTALNLIFKTDYFDIRSFKTTGTFAGTVKTEKQWILDELNQIFENTFLSNLKTLTI